MLLDLRPILPHRPPDPVPESVMTAAHHDLAVLTGVHGIDADGQVPVAVPRPDAAVDAVPGPVVVQDPDDASSSGGLDELAAARDFLPVAKRRDDPDGSAGPTYLVGHPPPGPGGGAAERHRSTGPVHEAAGRLRGRIEIARFVLQRAPLAELADPAVDQTRIDLRELPIANSPFVPLSRGGILDDDVGVRGERLQDLAPLRLGQVQRDGLLTAALRQEASPDLLTGDGVLEHVLLAPERGELSLGITAGWFDQDDLCPQLGEEGRAPVADGHHCSAVQDPDVAESLGLGEVLALPEILLEPQGVLLRLVALSFIDIIRGQRRNRWPIQHGIALCHARLPA